MKYLIILSAIVFGFISCSESDPPEPTHSISIDKGSYQILIDNTTTGVKTQLIDANADTNWDPETGTIFMNTDDSLSCGGDCPCLLGPIGTITMNLVIQPHVEWRAIQMLLVSKSDVVCGTAEQLNAQLFEALVTNHNLDSVVIGANFIAARFDELQVELVLLNSTQQPETATVSGKFIAVSK